VHNRLAGLLAERSLKVLGVVGAEKVAGDGLAAVLVYPLQDLVAGGVAQAREERDKLAAEAGVGLILEDDGVELTEGSDLEKS